MPYGYVVLRFTSCFAFFQRFVKKVAVPFLNPLGELPPPFAASGAKELEATCRNLPAEAFVLAGLAQADAFVCAYPCVYVFAYVFGYVVRQTFAVCFYRH